MSRDVEDFVAQAGQEDEAHKLPKDAQQQVGFVYLYVFVHDFLVIVVVVHTTTNRRTRAQSEAASLAALEDAWNYGREHQQQQQQQPPADFHEIYKYGLLRVLRSMRRWRQGFMQWQQPDCGCSIDVGGADDGTGLCCNSSCCTRAPSLDCTMLAFSEFVRLFLQGQLKG